MLKLKLKIYNKVVLKSALTGTTLDNDMDGKKSIMLN